MHIVFGVYVHTNFIGKDKTAQSVDKIIFGHSNVYDFTEKNPGPIVRNLGQKSLISFESQDNNKLLIYWF